MLDYAALDAVACVLREGSFERAAALLNVTPSAVSQRVRALEERLGTVLIRRGQPATATEAGARLRAHLERVRLLEGELAEDLPFLSAGAGGANPTIRVAVNADSLATWLLPAIAAFARRGLALVDLIAEDETQTGERLRKGEVLAAVTTDATPIQGCGSIALGAMRYAATASPAFVVSAFAEGVTAEALDRAPMLRFDRRDLLQAHWIARATGGAAEPPVHWVPSSEAFVALALAGVGWGMNPLALVAPHLASGALVELVPGLTLDVPLVWQHARVGAALLRTLTRDVVAEARGALVPPNPRAGPDRRPISPTHPEGGGAA